MFAQTRLRQMLAAAVLLALPAIGLPAAKAKGAQATGKTAVAKTKRKAAVKKPPYVDQMRRLQKILSDMQKEVEKYQYNGLFLGPNDKPVQGLVSFPADKFIEQVDEIKKIAEGCHRQMKARQAAARDYYLKINAPQAAAFSTCEAGMKEVLTLIEELRNGATWVMTNSGGTQQAKFYMELGHLERTIAKIRALAGVCQRSMRRADMLCTRFETKNRGKKKPRSKTW